MQGRPVSEPPVTHPHLAAASIISDSLAPDAGSMLPLGFATNSAAHASASANTPMSSGNWASAVADEIPAGMSHDGQSEDGQHAAHDVNDADETGEDKAAHDGIDVDDETAHLRQEMHD